MLPALTLLFSLSWGFVSFDLLCTAPFLVFLEDVAVEVSSGFCFGFLENLLNMAMYHGPRLRFYMLLCWTAGNGTVPRDTFSGWFFYVFFSADSCAFVVVVFSISLSLYLFIDYRTSLSVAVAESWI